MLIDWFTVAAQGLNFVALVWLLQRYLYKPVLAAIDLREKQIALALADAASQKLAAEQERALMKTQTAALDAERATLLKQATSAALAQGARLLAAAHAQADALRATEAAALRVDQTRLRESIVRLARQEVLAIARKVLKDLASASLEEQMAVLFARRLRDLGSAEKQTLAAAFATAAEAVVHSAFALSESQRGLLQGAVNQAFSTSARLHFELSSETLCGVELLVGGQKLAWSTAEYLRELEQKLSSLKMAGAPALPAMITPAAEAVAMP